MTRLKDGSILSSNLVYGNSGLRSMAGMGSANSLAIGQVIETLYIDHERNRSKRFVEYDVLVNDKGISSSVFKNCRSVDSYGDENNFSEKVLQPVTEGKRGKKDNSEAYAYKNGSAVLISFVGGNKESPVILCSLQHPHIKLETQTNKTPVFTPVGSSTSRDSRMEELPTLTPGAKSTGDNEGQRILGEFQGLRWNINKDGELTVIYQGPKDAKGTLKNSASQPTVIKINKEGELILLDNLDQEIKISRKDQKIYLSSGNSDPDFIEIDRANKNITIDCGHDEIHVVDNDQNTTVKRNEKKSVTKESNISVGQNRKVKVGKIWTVDAGKQTVIVAPKVTVGGVGANEPLVLGNIFKTFYNAMVNIFNNHTHCQYDWAPAPSGNVTHITHPPSSVGPVIPTPIATNNMSQDQLSDFCYTRKRYVGK